MTKRPTVDLASLTSEAAVPMPEATPRTAHAPAPIPATPPSPTHIAHTKTADLEAISFKVPPAFRKRFKQRAVNADLKLNELLFAALEAWEEKHNLKR